MDAGSAHRRTNTPIGTPSAPPTRNGDSLLQSSACRSFQTAKALNQEAVADDQGRGLERREYMQPRRGRNEPERKARKSRDERRREGGREIERDLETRPHAQSPREADSAIHGRTRPLHRGQTQRFSSSPMPEIEMRTVSPAFRKRGGSKPMPTPAGVPVAMMSPGRRVVPAEIVAIRVGMSKMRSRVLALWRSSPLTQHFTSRFSGSSASAVVIHGPMGQNVSRVLPRNHCL